MSSFSWRVPPWMHKYLRFLTTTKDIDALVNGHADLYTNPRLALEQSSMKAQIQLLTRLYDEGILK